MTNEKIRLEDVGYTICNDVLAKYPDFKLVVMLGDNEIVINAEAAFTHKDSKEIIHEMLDEYEATDQLPVALSRIRIIDFVKAMELVGFGLPFKNYPILHALIELGFITKDEVQDAE